MLSLLRTFWQTLFIILDVFASPFLFHADRFPQVPRAEIQELCRFNRSYQEKLWKNYEVWPGDEVTRQSLREAELLWKAWDCLDDVRNDMFSVRRRRQALGKILEIIGPDAFLRGEMPPPIPIWRFIQVRN